ncbi:hypothetical protein C7431_10671 [Pantoea allii]|uniref:Uncharacterized protein n=1 Tax=Pantoea allii TaxID=574096 RepID=A0A2V2BI42_9GAMM|nr:hypothetical protein C7431_10671 [Pantoea allii]
MDRETLYLLKTLDHNNDLLDEINRAKLGRYYNTKILRNACNAIEAELRRRGIL